ncbi:hypothetical protein IW261DRAFT_1062409 [Armillaria novae-zelandiae]|uniref:Uncharacterized protein n=1 Tax=Armillaria novae-zelandiae TaxID=153914 RepID=A0AA39NKS1_9AGAR|nr:hypothetical protein IW261DRAFT_1062409 [Armillaria novae-zelandiae]
MLIFDRSSTESAKGTGTPPSTHRSHRTSIIIGAVTGTVVSLLLLVGCGAFLFMCHRKRRNWRHRRLSPNLKIHPEPEQSFHSPPVGNKNSESVSPMLESEMTPNSGDIIPDTVEQDSEGIQTEDVGERRNSIESRLHVDTSEPQSAEVQDNSTEIQGGRHAVLDDVAAEVLRLRVQVQQLMEREAERNQGLGDVLGPPPAYA